MVINKMKMMMMMMMMIGKERLKRERMKRRKIQTNSKDVVEVDKKKMYKSRGENFGRKQYKEKEVNYVSDVDEENY